MFVLFVFTECIHGVSALGLPVFMLCFVSAYLDYFTTYELVPTISDMCLAMPCPLFRGVFCHEWTLGELTTSA